MATRRGFSDSAVHMAAMKMRMGIKPTCHVSDNLSDEDIARAWREASMKVFGGRKNYE